MAPFPYVPIAVIVASLVSDQVIQMSVFSYAGFMVEDLGAVDDKDKAGETSLLPYLGFIADNVRLIYVFVQR